MSTITIDKDIVSSLYGLYFGDISDKYKAACFRAYRDFNRTIDFGINQSQLSKQQKKQQERLRTQWKNEIVAIFREQIIVLHNIEDINQERFNEWHTNICNSIKNNYIEKGVSSFTYGQAQKWVNMTIKYLYLLQADSFTREFNFLHIPIDNYVMDIALTRFGIQKPNTAWSTWDMNQYTRYQNELRSHIVGEPPLRWEFHSWLEIARNINNSEN